MGENNINVPLIYIGHEEKLEYDKVYNCQFTTLQTGSINTINVIVQIEHQEPLWIVYDNIVEFLQDWIYAYDANTLVDKVQLFSHIYEKYELIESMSCLKSMVESYKYQLKENSNTYIQVSKAYDILRDLILEKVK